MKMLVLSKIPTNRYIVCLHHPLFRNPVCPYLYLSKQHLTFQASYQGKLKIPTDSHRFPFPRQPCCLYLIVTRAYQVSFLLNTSGPAAQFPLGR